MEYGVYVCLVRLRLRLRGRGCTIYNTVGKTHPLAYRQKQLQQNSNGMEPDPLAEPDLINDIYNVKPRVQTAASMMDTCILNKAHK